MFITGGQHAVNSGHHFPSALSLSGERSGRGRPPGATSSFKVADKAVIFVFALIMILIGSYMYFGTAAGGKIVDFIDLKISLGSISIPSGIGGLYGHAILGASFNAVVLDGKVKANMDVPAGTWLAAKVIITGYCDCDPTGCGRTMYTGPSKTTYYYLIADLGGMRQGEVKPFQFILTKEDLLKEIQALPAFLVDKMPDYVNGFAGRIDLAVVRVNTPPQRTVARYPMVWPDEIYRTYEGVYRWKFQLALGKPTYQSILRLSDTVGFREVNTLEDGITVTKQSLTDVRMQSLSVELRLSVTAALLMFSIPIAWLLYTALINPPKRKKGGGLLGGGGKEKSLAGIVTRTLIILFVVTVIIIALMIMGGA